MSPLTEIPSGWQPLHWADNLERISKLTDFGKDLSGHAEAARQIRLMYPEKPVRMPSIMPPEHGCDDEPDDHYTDEDYSFG